FGEVYGTTGTSQTTFGFTGEPTDANGLVNLRARYYNPTLGVFPSRDPLEGAVERPMSLNEYSWVEGRVINWSDPLGLDGGASVGILGVCVAAPEVCALAAVGLGVIGIALYATNPTFRKSTNELLNRLGQGAASIGTTVEQLRLIEYYYESQAYASVLAEQTKAYDPCTYNAPPSRPAYCGKQPGDYGQIVKFVENLLPWDTFAKDVINGDLRDLAKHLENTCGAGLEHILRQLTEATFKPFITAAPTPLPSINEATQEAPNILQFPARGNQKNEYNTWAADEAKRLRIDPCDVLRDWYKAARKSGDTDAAKKIKIAQKAIDCREHRGD
ncbi:MAG: RHS repeat-associated core domain-containing protein, partial [Chloroflexota bacterium]